MAGTPVATLGSAGWIRDVGGKADSLFTYFCTCEVTQTLVYDGSITSLTDLLHRYGNDTVKLPTVMRDALIRYFTPYFDKVEINIDIDDNDPQNEHKDAFSIVLTGTVTEDNVPYSLNYLIKTSSGKLSAFNKLNEG